MRFLIPSYRRCGNVHTIDLLRGYGVKSRDITIGVQTKDDYRDYGNRYDGVRCVLTEARNAAGNRQGLLRMLNYGERAVLMDDDLVSFSYLVVDGERGKLVRMEGDAFYRMLRSGFSLDADIFGVSNVANCVMMTKSLKGGKRVSINSMVTGNFMGVSAGRVRFDPSIDLGEDYEACAHVVCNGGRTAKLKDVTFRTKARNGVAPGGCHDLYRRLDHRAELQKIVDRYPGIVRFSRKTSLRMVNV